MALRLTSALQVEDLQHFAPLLREVSSPNVAPFVREPAQIQVLKPYPLQEVPGFHQAVSSGPIIPWLQVLVRESAIRLLFF